MMMTMMMFKNTRFSCRATNNSRKSVLLGVNRDWQHWWCWFHVQFTCSGFYLRNYR